MKQERYYVLNLKYKKDPNASTSKIYESLGNVKHLNIPFIPLKSIASGMAFANSADNTETNLQIALPQDIDHSTVYKMVSTVNDEIDVTLLGEQSKSSLKTEADPEKYGLDYFVLGEKYEGLGK